MKNEKVVKVLEAVIKVCRLTSIIAETIIEALPVVQPKVKKPELSADAKLVEEFLKSEKIDD